MEITTINTGWSINSQGVCNGNATCEVIGEREFLVSTASGQWFVSFTKDGSVLRHDFLG